MRINSTGSILIAHSTISSSNSFTISKERMCFWIITTQLNSIHRSTSSRTYFFWNHLSQCTKQYIYQTLTRNRISRTGSCWIYRIYQGTFRCYNLKAAICSRIRWNRGICHCSNNIINASQSHRTNTIQRSSYLRACSRKINFNMWTSCSNCYLDF